MVSMHRLSAANEPAGVGIGDNTYRADGMRLSKTRGENSVRYSYDGQMPVEERMVNVGDPVSALPDGESYPALDSLLASTGASLNASLLNQAGGGMGPVGSGMGGGPYGGVSGGGIGVMGGGAMGLMGGGSGAGEMVLQYAIGPRGTEKITSRDAQTGNTIQVLYAMYDAHGNMMCTARRSGSQLLIENHRGYDAWGAIR